VLTHTAINLYPRSVVKT